MQDVMSLKSAIREYGNRMNPAVVVFFMTSGMCFVLSTSRSCTNG